MEALVSGIKITAVGQVGKNSGLTVVISNDKIVPGINRKIGCDGIGKGNIVRFDIKFKMIELDRRGSINWLGEGENLWVE